VKKKKEKQEERERERDKQYFKIIYRFCLTMKSKNMVGLSVRGVCFFAILIILVLAQVSLAEQEEESEG
jgi:hypothetical protein